MFGKVEGWILNMLLKAKIGGIIGKLFSKMTGWKSVITLILIIAIKVVIYLGVVPASYLGIANEIVTALYGALTISLGDKFKRYYEAVTKAMDDVIEKK